MNAWIHWPHFTSKHKGRIEKNGKPQLHVEASGGKWRWYTVNDQDFIRCDNSLIPVTWEVAI